MVAAPKKPGFRPTDPAAPSSPLDSTDLVDPKSGSLLFALAPKSKGAPPKSSAVADLSQDVEDEGTRSTDWGNEVGDEDGGSDFGVLDVEAAPELPAPPSNGRG